MRTVFALYGGVRALLFEPTDSTEEGGSRGVAGTLKRAERTETLSHGKELPEDILLSLTDRLTGRR